MRLWHKDLIEGLPRQQLLAQWRECCCIARNISVNGTPNHILVNKILDYSSVNFIEYTNLILKEMRKRGYKINENSYLKFCSNMDKSLKYFKNNNVIIGQDWLFKNWHNERYLTQCYNNLQEKYDCGGVKEKEWKVFEDCYFKYINESKS